MGHLWDYTQHYETTSGVLKGASEEEKGEKQAIVWRCDEDGQEAGCGACDERWATCVEEGAAGGAEGRGKATKADAFQGNAFLEEGGGSRYQLSSDEETNEFRKNSESGMDEKCEPATRERDVS